MLFAVAMRRFYNPAMHLRWVLVMVVVLPAVLSGQQPVPSGQAREAVISRLADLRRIHTPNGIEVLEEVPSATPVSG